MLASHSDQREMICAWQKRKKMLTHAKDFFNKKTAEQGRCSRRRHTMCYWRKIYENIKYLEIEKRYGHAVSGILKANGSPLKENY